VSRNTELVVLKAHLNQLTSLDVSRSHQLVELAISENRLERLDVSNNPRLTGLFVGGNNLRSLDISKNTDLQFLFCHDNPSLSSLDVTRNEMLLQLVTGANTNVIGAEYVLYYDVW
jgi:Leucine-rich repeat (LRR) protein